MSHEHSPARTRATSGRFMTKHEVKADLRWSETTLWRRIKAGDYPAPIKAGPGTNSPNLFLTAAHERYVQRLLDAAEANAGHHDDAA